MIERPHDQVIIALLDAVATGPVLPTGGVDRAAVECAEALRGINGVNLAPERYRREHPGSTEADRDIFDEGLRLLAEDGTAWLLDQGHLRLFGERGLALGEPIEIDGEPYVPGANLALDWKHKTRRRLIPARVDLIRESVKQLPGLEGFFPILVDKQGNVIDGRHRQAVNPAWPRRELDVPPEVQLAITIAANRSSPWEADKWAQLSKYAEYVHGKQTAQGELARLALLEDPVRENEVIAGLVGCSWETVRATREEQEELDRICVIRFTPGPRKKDGLPRRSKALEAKRIAEIEALRQGVSPPEPVRRTRKKDDPALIEAVHERVADGTFNRKVADELAERFDTSHGVVEAVKERVIGRLEATPAPDPESPRLRDYPIEVPEPVLKPVETELPPLVDEVEVWVSRLKVEVSSPEVLRAICVQILEHVRGL